MPTETRSPGTIVSDAVSGSRAWSSPGNAGASDDAYASVLLAGGTSGNPGETSERLKATDFGFTIPPHATINSIVARIERRVSPGLTIGGRAAWWIVGGAYDSVEGIPGLWTDEDQVATLLSQSSGLPTVAEVNAAGFGCALDCRNESQGGEATAFVDHLEIEVDYTPLYTPLEIAFSLRPAVAPLGPLALAWSPRTPVATVDPLTLAWTTPELQFLAPRVLGGWPGAISEHAISSAGLDRTPALLKVLLHHDHYAGGPIVARAADSRRRPFPLDF